MSSRSAKTSFIDLVRWLIHMPKFGPSPKGFVSRWWWMPGCELRLAFQTDFGQLSAMGLPTQPVTLTVAELEALNNELSTMRHDINNTLSMVLATIEMTRLRPQMADRM